MSSPLVEYRVSLASRARHLFDLEARFPVGTGDALDLKLPVWTPGSYLVREYQRHLQDLLCTDENGRPLATRKTGKSTWRVEAAGARTVVARYRVYAHEITVRTAHLDETHAFWNGANVLLYCDALRHAPARLRIEVPAGWRVATGLDPDLETEEPAPGGEAAYLAPDYDTLVDSPVEVSPHERLDFVAQGKPHAFAVWGRSRLDGRRLVEDVTAIVDAQAALFDGVPYDRYAFLLHLVPGGYGGLEHKNSCALIATPFAFSSEKKYQDLLELISHEFFHLWNGKRIRPAALGPFDYERECHTRSLWVVEGVTSYYDRLFLRRAGRITAARYLEKLGEDLTRLHKIPGRFRQSLEESSWDAWIKLYRPDENTVNSTVSYYLKGSVVALLLDLEIRRRSEGARSLDDVLRLLWARFQHDGQGYADAAVQPLVEEATGLRLDDFFAHHVRGRGEVDLDGPLATVGLRARRGPDQPGGGDAASSSGTGAWLGATLRQDGPRLRVAESVEDGPAQSGHLYPGDEIVACDGWRVDEAALRERLGEARPGDRVRLAVFRRDELREVTITLGRPPLDKIDVVPDEKATPEAKAAYKAWLGEELPAPRPAT
jgi:predicted metalloprotease with PDZ domain